jgi:hypothetical protein
MLMPIQDTRLAAMEAFGRAWLLDGAVELLEHGDN